VRKLSTSAMFSFPFKGETEYTMVVSPMLLFDQIRQVLSTNNVAILIQAKLQTAEKRKTQDIIRHDKHIVNSDDHLKTTV
jgi:superfamily II DNA helicase RecQ